MIAWNKFKIERTRGQIFFGFIFVMIIVLALTIGITYYVSLSIQKENTAQYSDEIAQQMTGRIEAYLNEINVLTLQLSTDARIQEMLESEWEGPQLSFHQRMAIRSVLLNTTAYSETINEIELYSNYSSIYPVVNKTIEERVPSKYLLATNQPSKLGDIIWIGNDPSNTRQLLAVRAIRLEHKKYQKGGYLVVQIKPDLIDSVSEGFGTIPGSVLNIYDNSAVKPTHQGDMVPILSHGTKTNQADDYISITRRIATTDWNLEILIPEGVIKDDVGFLRNVLLVSSILGIFLFALISYYLALFITRPINKLTSVMHFQNDGRLQENPDNYFNYEVNQLNEVYNKMVHRMNHLIKSVLEKEILKSKSEIKALHSQMNPHFLFNTLDSLYWSLIGKGEKALAQKLIKLSRLFRYTIESRELVTIKEEMEHVERYTDIMELRWGNRLSVETSIQEHLLNEMIPKLLIQPLVENAINHGIEPMETGGTVNISIGEEEQFILIRVKDNGIGMNGEKLTFFHQILDSEETFNPEAKGTGIGLVNIHKLVRFYFGENSGLSIYSEVNQGTTAEIRISRREIINHGPSCNFSS